MKLKRQRGFSLIEVMVVVGLIGIVTTLAFGALTGFRGRAGHGDGVATSVNALRKARAEAMGRGRAVAFVLDAAADDQGQRWWIVEGLGFSLDAFDPAAPANVIETGRLPAGAAFGPAATGFGKTLPVPFATIPTTSGMSPEYLHCSFCVKSGPNPNFGAVVFNSRGAATFSAGPGTDGQQFTVTGRGQDPTTAVVAVAITPNGLIETFE